MPDEYITLATFDTEVKAQMASAYLADAGIETRLADDNIVTMDWLLSNAVAGVKLQVRKVDSARAVDVFREMEAGSNKPEPIDEDELIRQALASEKEDENDSEPETDATEPQRLAEPATQPDTFDREEACRKLFFVAWLGLGIPCLGFYALYLFLRAALGTGTISPTRRYQLIVGSFITFISLILNYVIWNLYLTRE